MVISSLFVESLALEVGDQIKSHLTSEEDTIGNTSRKTFQVSSFPRAAFCVQFATIVSSLEPTAKTITFNRQDLGRIRFSYFTLTVSNLVLLRHFYVMSGR